MLARALLLLLFPVRLLRRRPVPRTGSNCLRPVRRHPYRATRPTSRAPRRARAGRSRRARTWRSASGRTWRRVWWSIGIGTCSRGADVARVLGRRRDMTNTRTGSQRIRRRTRTADLPRKAGTAGTRRRAHRWRAGARTGACMHAGATVRQNQDSEWRFGFADPWPDSWSTEWDKRIDSACPHGGWPQPHP